MVISYESLSIKEIIPWPVSILISFPRCIAIILKYWILYLIIFYSLFDIICILLKFKLWSMYSYNDQTFISIVLLPFVQIWNHMNTIFTCISPKMNKYNFSI